VPEPINANSDFAATEKLYQSHPELALNSAACPYQTRSVPIVIDNRYGPENSKAG